MKKEDLIKAVRNPHVRDYTYAIMFFIVSTFFILFVIRPVLTIAISIKREAQDLERINAIYEQNIVKVLQLQADIEDLRSRRSLLDDAMPYQPRVEQVISDIRRAASDSNVPIQNFTIGNIGLKGVEKPVNQQREFVDASMTVTGSYANVDALLRAITQQRRVKGIDQLSMVVVPGADGQINITMSLELEAYYNNAQDLLEQ